MEDRWVIYVVAIGIYLFYTLFKGWKKGRALYTLKKIINNNCYIVNTLLGIYIIIVGASFIAPLNDFTMAQADKYKDIVMAYYIFRSVPLASVFLIIFIVFKVFSVKWIPYNDKEKEWLKEDDKNAFNIRKYLAHKFVSLKWMWKDEVVTLDKDKKDANNS